MKYYQIVLVYILLPLAVCAQNNETLYLSGTGYGDEHQWDFCCSGGRNNGTWQKIAVPSCWEMQGFGEYTYGRYYLKKGAKPSDESGIYKYRFSIPNEWKEKCVKLTFEGVMTDAEVYINGTEAGEKHQGGFCSFSYDVSHLLHYDGDNEIVVNVKKQSENASVNAAERRADWWLFGGIYRPVYLTAMPTTHIANIAIDARCDGSVSTRLSIYGIKPHYKLSMSLCDMQYKAVDAERILDLSADSVQTVHTKYSGVKAWNTEHPYLYHLILKLKDDKGHTVHVYRQRIGFRTIEFRPADGIYLNGTKIVVKGVNRHCFYPESGRTLNESLCLKDARLIKDMNMNAIRSHYPPDSYFLDICDSLGILYLEELPGWQNHYDDKVGGKLLREMITRDVNHPCIFLWSNGNEGGFNYHLDSLFYQLDPQKRHVVHPWADYDGIDANHYPTYGRGPYRLEQGQHVFMPTEFLHAQYDGGAGAGLEDYWNKFRESPLFAGGFIWAFLDEAVARTDKRDTLDSSGPDAPDGIVGPHREKEGSYYTIKDVWSPIQIKTMKITKSFMGDFFITNDYMFTRLGETKMTYRLLRIPSPPEEGEAITIGRGMVSLPNISPGETSKAHFDLPSGFFDADVLCLEAIDAHGDTINTWSWPIKSCREYTQSIIPKAGKGKVKIRRNNDDVTFEANRVAVTFSMKEGILKSVCQGKDTISFCGGPLPVGMKMEAVSSAVRSDGGDAVFTVSYKGAADSIIWRMSGDGLVSMSAVLLDDSQGKGFHGAFYDNPVYQLGLTFSLSEKDVKGMRWMGRGPYRVWKNRLRGVPFGLWQKEYNNTITGESYDHLVYPEFKGYHSCLYWATFQGRHPFTVYSETDGLYLRIFTPQEPFHHRPNEMTMVPFPQGDISFLYEIPGIGSRMDVKEMGPHSAPSSMKIRTGDDGIRMKLLFDFRNK